jgi:nucleotide-binding universal stress UspA family protein
MTARRTAYDPGHKAKFLVVVDETEECDRAIYFAARRCARVGAKVLLLMINAPNEYENWLGVGEVMRAEAEEASRDVLERAAARSRAVAGIEPEWLIREGQRAEEIVRLIEEDRDIALLVLGAGSGAEGPGPLVSTLVGKTAGTFPIPIAVIPGRLTDDGIDALA